MIKLTEQLGCVGLNVAWIKKPNGIKRNDKINKTTWIC